MLVGRYRVPQPRNALALAVRDHASAAMDVSDGLAGDLAKLCAASGVSAVIDAQSIPLSAPAATLLARGTVGIEAIVSGGDDYEILCAIPEDSFKAFAQAKQGGPGWPWPRSERSSQVRTPAIPRCAGQGNRAKANVLQPFLEFPRKALDLDANTCRNRWFWPSAALRRGNDFGMVPPI